MRSYAGFLPFVVRPGLVFFTTFRPIKHDPDREIRREVFKPVGRLCSDEQNIPRLYAITLSTVNKLALSADYEVELVLPVRLLGVNAFGFPYLDSQATAPKQLQERGIGGLRKSPSRIPQRQND